MKNGPGEIAQRYEAGREHSIEHPRDPLNDGFLAQRRGDCATTPAEADAEFGQDFAHDLGHHDPAVAIDHRPQSGEANDSIDGG